MISEVHGFIQIFRSLMELHGYIHLLKSVEARDAQNYLIIVNNCRVFRSHLVPKNVLTLKVLKYKKF